MKVKLYGLPAQVPELGKVKKHLSYQWLLMHALNEALAQQLHKLGAKLILSGRRKEELERVQKDVGGETTILTLDLNEIER